MNFGRIQEFFKTYKRVLVQEPVSADSSNAAILFRSSTFSTRSDKASMPAPQTGKAGGSVLSLAGDSYYWSPARIFRLLWGISSTLPQQLQIVRILRYPEYADFLKSNPRFRFKFLIRDYLVRDFSAGDRTACFLHHYKRLHAAMPTSLLHQILQRKVTVVEERRDDLHLQISLCFSRPFEKEGELSLNLHVDGAVVFVMSFTIVPGRVVKSDTAEVLLISRLQGTNGYYPQIRAATKAMNDVGPVALLLAALHGFADALGIDRMAGVSARRQSTYSEELAHSYMNAYDGFFADLDIPKSAAGFFLSSIPLEDRPMSLIKQGHKIRTRKKRELKRQIAEDVCRVLNQG